MIYYPKSYQKLFAAALSAAMVTSSVVTIAPLSADAAENKSFSDVKSTDYFYDAVHNLTSRDIIKGYEDGTYRPYASVTRAQAAKILALTLGIDTTNVKNPGFTDVQPDDWYYGPVAALVEAGVLQGYGDTFKPQETLTRAQMAKIIALGFGFGESELSNNPFKDVQNDDWFASYLPALISNEITTGRTPDSFDPYAKVTRGQMAAFVFRSEAAINQNVVVSDIVNITNTSIELEDGTYELTENQKQWLNPSNLTALKGAIVKLKVQDGKIDTLESVEITANGTASDSTSNPYRNHVVLDGNGATLEGNLKISGDFVSVKNITILGDLEIGKEVKNSFYTEGITVEGDTIISETEKSESSLNKKLNNFYKSLSYKVPAEAFQAAADESTENSPVIVFVDADIKSVRVTKNGVIIESKGTTSVKEISVSSNVVLKADEGVVIPKIIVKEGATEVTIDATVDDLSIDTTEKLTVNGKGDIKNVTIAAGGKIKIDTQGKVDKVETKSEDTKITIGEKTKVGNIVVPEGSNAKDIIENYDKVKKNIEKIDGEKNPDAKKPSSGGGGGSSSGEDSGSNDGGSDQEPQNPQNSVLNLGDIVIKNSTDNAEDTITIKNTNINDVIRVYSSATGSSPIETVTATSSSVTLNTEALSSNGGYIWISIEEQGKIESSRVKKAYYAEDVTVYDAAGTYGAEDGQSIETINGDVVIDADDVVLQNIKIEGNLIISESVGEGEATLRNVMVTGNTTVMGGGVNSVYFIDTVLATVIVNKNNGTIRIVAEGSTNVREVVLESTVKIEEDGLTGDAAGFTDVTISDNLQSIDPNLQVELVGQFDTINSRAAQIRMNLPESTSINSLILNAAAAVFGQGAIRSVEVNADGSRMEQTPAEVVLNIPGSSIRIGDRTVTESESNASHTTLNNISVTQSYIALDLENFVSGINIDEDLIITATLGDDQLSESELEDLNLTYNANLRVIEYTPLMNADSVGKVLSFTITPKAVSVEGEVTSKIIGLAKTGSVTLGTGASGRITDIFGASAVNATINFTPTTNTGSTPVLATTDKNGYYSVNLPQGTYVGVISGAGYIDTNFLVTVTSDTFESGQNATAIRAAASNASKIMLSWNGLESDVDSHMIGPKVDGGEFHTYYADQIYSEGTVKYVDLDWDDTEYYGPETTTIRKWTDGRYVFYVHNYSGEKLLSESQSVVKVFEGNANNPLHTYNVPTNSGTQEYWAVFELFVSNNGSTFEYKPIDTMVSDSSWLSNPNQSLEEQISYAELILNGQNGGYSEQYLSELNELVSQAEEVLSNTNSTTTQKLDKTDKLYKKIANGPTVAEVTTFEQLKAAIESTEVTTINIMDDIAVTEKLQILSEKHINGNNHTLTATSPTGWDSFYALQFYQTTGSVKDLNITGADAAIYVNGSTVSLEGTIDVSGNEFGGIEVSKGEGVTEEPVLSIGNATLLNDDEVNSIPTIWEDQIGEVTSANRVSGFGDMKVDYNQKAENNIQRFYYLSDAFSAPNQIESSDPAIVEVTTFDQLKTAVESTEVTTINIMNDIAVTEKLQILSEKHISGNNHTLTATSPTGWDSFYALQFYQTTGSVKDLNITGADAAIYVNGSTVSLEGTIDVSGNEFGGIEVSKGEGVTEEPVLSIGNATLLNDNEANSIPTIWEDQIGEVTSANRVSGFGDMKVDYNQKAADNIQRFYYLNNTLSAPTPVDI